MQLPGPSGDYVELVERPLPVDAAQAGRAGCIILEVDDIKTAHKLAVQRHASGLTSPVQTPGKGWSFDMLDPDGTMVTIEQPPSNMHKTTATR
jgi:predicted enzyme related to lactoylglutathione lyase